MDWPGDDVVPDAPVVMDREAVLPGSAEQLWPWLVQLGKDRAGWYFPRWAERVIPAKGRGIRHLDQFQVARQFARKQGIGKHLLQLGNAAAGLALQVLHVDLVDGSEAQEQLHRQRALVALDQVEIGRRDRQRLGHRGLGQAETVADAADPGAGKDLVLNHLSIL